LRALVLKGEGKGVSNILFGKVKRCFGAYCFWCGVVIDYFLQMTSCTQLLQALRAFFSLSTV
jgi:hypothetical protein